MGLLAAITNTALGNVARPPILPEPPLHELLATRLAEAENAVPALADAWRDANFLAETRPGPETAEALKIAAGNLTAGNNRVEAIHQALMVAREQAIKEAEQQAAADHTHAVKALEAHLTTLRRKGKALSAHLQNANREFTALLAAVEEVTKLWPKASGVRMPHAELTGLVQIQQMIRTEIVRLIATADPSAFTRIGNHHRNFMTVRDMQDGQIAGLRRTGGPETLPSMETRMAQAAQSLVNTAKANPPKSVSWSAPRLPSVVGEPVGAAPHKVTTADIPDLAALKTEHAEFQGLINSPTPPAWNASDLEAQKAEWARLHDGVEQPPEGAQLDALASEWNNANSDPELVEEFRATQPRPGGDTDATE